MKPFPRIRDLFERLRNDGIEIALASSAKEDELKAYKKITGIGPYLSEKVSSDDVTDSKPDPDIFRVARKKLGVDPENIVAVGDTPYDAESTGKAGIATIGVLCGGWSASQLRAAGCVAVYRDPADLLDNYASSPLVARGTADSMNIDTEKQMNSNNAFYFFMGLGIGAIAGLICAPNSGQDTRDYLKSKSEEGARLAKQAAGDAADFARRKPRSWGRLWQQLSMRPPRPCKTRPPRASSGCSLVEFSKPEARRDPIAALRQCFAGPLWPDLPSVVIDVQSLRLRQPFKVRLRSWASS